MPDDSSQSANPDRRSFLITAAGACLVAATAPGAVARVTHASAPAPVPLKPRRSTPPESLRLPAFRTALQTGFTVRHAHGTARFTLVDADDRPGQARRAHGKVFSLLFRGPASRPLEQGTYEFAHPALGTFPLFVVPVGTGGRYVLYEAVFNRALPPDRPEAPTPSGGKRRLR